jgi:hypothetical protein
MDSNMDVVAEGGGALLFLNNGRRELLLLMVLFSLCFFITLQWALMHSKK